MISKFRQLSIVKLARQSKRVPYATLQVDLDITNVRDLEDLIIDTIYAGLLDGRLDQANAVLNVKSCMARDVRPEEDVDAMIIKLVNWQVRQPSGNVSVFSETFHLPPFTCTVGGLFCRRRLLG